MHLKTLFTVLIVLLAFNASMAQTKNEKEERINRSDFPEKAQNVIQQLPKACKRIKFYKEIDGENVSFETKFKYKRQRYSLEFSADGTIEDIEVIVKPKAIETQVITNIASYFKSTYLKYRYIKLQKQFLFNKKDNPTEFVLKTLSQNSKAKSNYEIIAEIKEGNTREIREFTFDSNGSFLSYRVVEPTSYEHVLY